jgi:hypothetical protein
MISIPSSIAHGADPLLHELPIINLPSDTLKVRRRLRNDDFAFAFVKTARGITRYALEYRNSGLALVHEQGSNTTDPQ